MLRILTALCLISLTLSCAHKDAGKGLAKLSGRNTTGETEALELEGDPLPDSTFYVGYVDYFPETHEFYTSLFYREGHEYPDEDLLESKLDSVIVFDDDWGRERLPLDEAKRMLVLSGLDTLLVFNRKNEQICKCPLTRVEYLWNGLESYFIAVFKAAPHFPGQTEELYGISGNFPQDHKHSFLSEEVKDVRFDQFLINKLRISKAREWEMRHYRITSPETTYSIISSYSEESDEGNSYLTILDDNTVRIVNVAEDDSRYLNILPVPVIVNGKPLLLISAGYPSSDVLWDYLAAFDGQRYEEVRFNRVHLKDISPQWPIVLSQAWRR